MHFTSYENLSGSIRDQIDQLCGIWRKRLSENLLGLYIHGSMALGRFVEGVSDIDALVVTGRRISRKERLLLAGDIIGIDNKPCPLEISALWLYDIHPWRYPTPCQFHYSDYWTVHYSKLLSGEIEKSALVDDDFEDTDIACHIKHTTQCGICVTGRAIEDLFPDVPEADFWHSISHEAETFDFYAYNPKYYPSNILFLGRILSYKIEKRILSKYDAGLWALGYVPKKYRCIIENAMQVWYGDGALIDHPPSDLEELRQFFIGEIRAQ